MCVDMVACDVLGGWNVFYEYVLIGLVYGVILIVWYDPSMLFM